MRLLYPFVFLGLAALVAHLPSVGTAQAGDGAVATLGVDDIKPGMKGYGLTVFEGTEPARFDVEVIDVLRNFRPDQDLILIKTPHPRLNVAKVVAGMSGSPIYIADKLVGAYAYGWPFGEEPVAGVTPIRSMLEDMARPLPKELFGWPLKLPRPLEQGQISAQPVSANRFDGDAGDYDLQRHAQQLTKRHPAALSAAGQPDRPMPVATPMLFGGIGADSIELARELFAPLGLEPMQAGGGGVAEPGAPTRYVDGGAVGVQMVRGDMSAMGLGTVTHVAGDRLVAFGHPMMGAGATAVPTAVGRVLWFLASSMRSFKMGVPVRPVGAMVNDRQASIVVSHSAQAPVVPVSLHIKGAAGAPRTDWHFEVAHEKFMAPSLVAVALGSALQATAAERQDVSWEATSRLVIKGFGEVEFQDYGVSIGGTPDPREFIGSNLVSAMGGLLNNPWEPVLLERAEMTMELRYARDMLRLRGVEVLDTEVEAGQSVRVRLNLVPYAGSVIQRVVQVPIPAHRAGEKVTLEFQPGYTVEKEKAPPNTLAELVSNLEDPTYPPKSLVVSYGDGSGVAFKGRVATQLPPGALDVFRPTSATITPSTFESQARHVLMFDQFVIGKDRVTVDVKAVRR